MRARAVLRQHSKSTLVRASQGLFRERGAIVALEGRRWRRRLWLAVGAAFVGGWLAGQSSPPHIALDSLNNLVRHSRR